MQSYQFVFHQKTIQKLNAYHHDLLLGKTEMGFYLYKELQGVQLTELSSRAFLEAILNTKKPKIFAESEVNGDGTDWNQEELSILGDLGAAVPVMIYDNGRHRNPLVHAKAFDGLLLFTPGALLRGKGNQPADWDEVVNTESQTLDLEAYAHLYERRLVPLLYYADQYARERGKRILITIPGLGCGQFAGPFQGSLGESLRNVLIQLFGKYRYQFSQIAGVYYDPYNECENEMHDIEGLPFFVRPLTKGNEGKSQLSEPKSFNEGKYDFSDCLLASFVAWDHVSWPGNDYYLGLRATDDGVKAAASSTMFAMTGLKGSYSRENYAYLPPANFHNWNEVIIRYQMKLKVE